MLSKDDVVLKVSGRTDPNKLAKSIEMTAREQGGGVKIRAMGPHSVNQTVKGLVICRENLIAQDRDLAWTACFAVKEEKGEQITVLVFRAAILYLDDEEKDVV